MREELLALFRTRFGAAPECVRFAPGRVNLIGEHVDYNLGPVAPLPLDRGTYAAARRRPGTTVRLISRDQGDGGRFDLDSSDLDAVTGWARYPASVFLALRETGREVTGCDLAVAGDLVVGAGLSSSAALLVACLRALDELFRLDLTPVQIAELAHRAETRYVGVSCGIMDQMAAAVAKPGHALLLDCRDRSFRHVPVDRSRVGVVVVDSGTRRSLADSQFNTRVAECRQAVEVLARHDPAVTSLRDATPEHLQRHGAEMGDAVEARARHVVAEINRVFRFTRALEQGEFDTCGELLRASHRSLRDLYEASTAALDFLARRASELPGTFGARLTGAGWGGCVLALTRAGAERELVATVGPEYERRFGRRAAFHVLGETNA